MADVMNNFLVQCTTKGCENQGITIEITAVGVSPDVQCGSCSKQITAIRKL